MVRQVFSTVAVLVFDRTPLFETSVPISVFGVDRCSSGAPRFELRVVAGEPGTIKSTGGMRLQPPRGLRSLAGADVIVVPTWRDPDELPPRAALKALRRAHDE